MFRSGTWKRRVFDAVDSVVRLHRIRNPVAVAMALMSEKDRALMLVVRGYGVPRLLAAKLMGISRKKATSRLRRNEKLVRFVADALLVKEVQRAVGKAWKPRLGVFADAFARVGK